MTDGPRIGATETFDRTRTECSEPPLTEPSAPAPEQGRLSRRGRAVLATAGVALASLLMAASVGCGTKTEAPANPGQTAPTSPEAKPAPSASAAEAIPTVESLEVDSSLLKDPKALIETFVDERTTEWFNAGANPENAKAAINSSTENIDEFATRIAAKYDKMFIDALLVKDWQSNLNIVKWVDNMIFIHRPTLALYFYTSFPDVNSQDKEPYRRTTEHAHIDSTANQTNKSVTIIDTEQNFDNADLNRVGEGLTAGKKVENEIGNVTRTFVVVDGKMQLSDSALLSLE